MEPLNLTGGSYQARGVSVSAQRCLNLYPEPIPPEQGEPAQEAYYPTPGLSIFSEWTAATARCAYQTTQGDAIFVIGIEVLLVAYDGTTSRIGQITPGITPVRMSDNGTTLFVVDGVSGAGWYCSLPEKPQYGAYGTFTKISDEAFYGSKTIAILDTFFLFVNPDTTNWYTSPAQFSDESTTPFDSLYVASDATSLSTIEAIAVVGQYIWLFGRFQTEFWYNSGATDFPFQRVQGVTVESGCMAPYSVANLPTTQVTPNGGIMWLGSDRSGLPRVYMGQQTTAVPVSTFPIEGALQKYANLSAAVGNVYQENGHVFYILTVPGTPSSWVYDVSTGLWHERCSTGSGGEDQIRPLFITQAYGKILGCDRDNGRIYEISCNYGTDNGVPIKRQRAFPHLLTAGHRGIHRQFMLNMQAGNGITANIDWSDDRGASFGYAIPLFLGDTGNTWPSIWRLGMARDRVYRVTWESSNTTALLGAFIQIDQVRS